MEENKLKRFNKIFPWYDGLSGDLLFWVAIDTLFLTVVKNFTASQIVSLTSISMIINILLQVPLLKIIHKIGNTKSVRLGSFLLLISSILLTFGKNYITIVIGKIFYEMAFTFQNMINAVLKNNLELQHTENEYIKYRTKANTIYAAVTMIISFVASIMFNINNYLPMIGCITFCVICFILSWYMVDYSKDNKNKLEKNKETGKGKIKYTKIIIFILLSYGLCYPMVNSGQSNGKLFIQQELLKLYDVEKTSLVIGAILCVSRIVRLLSNIKFDKIHKKYEDKVGIMLPVGLLISLILMLIGYNVSNMPVMKFVIMGFGYVIILFIRDPFKVYMQDLALKNTDKNRQQTLLTTMELSRKIVRTIISLSFTTILLKYPMVLVISILTVLSIIEIFVSIYLYKIIMNNNEKEQENEL
jgi:membrane protein